MNKNTELQQEEASVPCTEEATDIATAQTKESSPALHEEKVFGISRICFWGILLGYGSSLILCGLFGVITGMKLNSTVVPSLLGAAIGYLMGAQITKKLKAQHTDQKSNVKNS